MPIGRVNAALLLISFGLILILINVGFLDWTVLGEILRLWPILLVAIGLQLLFSHRLRLLGLTSTLLLMGTVWGVMYTHLEGAGVSLRPRVTSWKGDLPADVQRLELQVSIRKGRLNLAVDHDLAVQARTKSWGGEPRIRLLRGQESLVVMEGQGGGLPILPSDEWSVNLPGAVLASLLLEADRTDLHLDLRGLTVELLRIEGHGNTMDIHLNSTPPAPRLEIDSSGGSLRVVRPPGVGILIVAEGKTTWSNLEGSGFRREGSVFVSPDYEEAAVQAYLKVRSDLVRLEVTGLEGSSDE